MLKWILLWLALPLAAIAADDADLDRLHEALKSEALIAILSDEGLVHGEDLREAMFPGRGGAGWSALVADVYDQGALFQTFRAAFDEQMNSEALEDVLVFYQSNVGAKIAQHELEARRAISAQTVEDAAISAYQTLTADGPADRLTLLHAFEAANALIDQNVAGGLNSNLAFYKGLTSGGGFEMTESQMLAEVWGQADEIRAESTEWVFGFLTMAYDNLSDEELQAYVAFSKSESGQDLNRALFAGFDAVFLTVSYELGALAGRFTQSDEL